MLKRLGLAFGLLVTAGSHLRASPTRSYVAWASVATDERPSAPVSKTVPLSDFPRGGLVAVLSGRRAPAAASVASAACAAAKSARASTTDASSPVAAPRASERPALAPSASAAAATGRQGAAAATFVARKGGTTGGSGAPGRAGGGSAGSGPSWRGGWRRLMFRGRLGCLLSTCKRIAIVDLTNPHTEHGDGVKKGLMIPECGARQGRVGRQRCGWRRGYYPRRRSTPPQRRPRQRSSASVPSVAARAAYAHGDRPGWRRP